VPRESPSNADQLALDFEEGPETGSASGRRGGENEEGIAADPDAGEAAHLRAALDANPELRAAWQEAQAYRETFSTPEEARAAMGLLADLNRMDALFFSGRAEDHAELARGGGYRSCGIRVTGAGNEWPGHTDAETPSKPGVERRNRR
jgi:hypothetical protein